MSRSRCVQVRSVAKTPLPLVTPDATTQLPAMRPGARPPAIPKLMIPDAPRAMAASSAARNPELWLQITDTPGPRAIPASSARQVTATTPACSDIHTPLPGAFIPKAAVMVNVATCGKTKQQAGILQMFGDDSAARSERAKCCARHDTPEPKRYHCRVRRARRRE
jgi:hypothetical protein